MNTETLRQRQERLERQVPGYLSDRDIERLLAALENSDFTNQLAKAIAQQIWDYGK
jgi:hypothetical protein